MHVELPEELCGCSMTTQSSLPLWDAELRKPSKCYQKPKTGIKMGQHHVQAGVPTRSYLTSFYSWKALWNSNRNLLGQSSVASQRGLVAIIGDGIPSIL